MGAGLFSLQAEGDPEKKWGPEKAGHSLARPGTLQGDLLDFSGHVANCRHKPLLPKYY